MRWPRPKAPLPMRTRSSWPPTSPTRMIVSARLRRDRRPAGALSAGWSIRPASCATCRRTRRARELFREILDVNLVGSFIASCAALERMGASLSIVNMASVSGIRANRGRVAYGASKAGLKPMSEVLALEFGSRNVRVNSRRAGSDRDADGVEAARSRTKGGSGYARSRRAAMASRTR